LEHRQRVLAAHGEVEVLEQARERGAVLAVDVPYDGVAAGLEADDDHAQQRGLARPGAAGDDAAEDRVRLVDAPLRVPGPVAPRPQRDRTGRGGVERGHDDVLLDRRVVQDVQLHQRGVAGDGLGEQVAALTPEPGGDYRHGAVDVVDVLAAGHQGDPVAAAGRDLFAADEFGPGQAAALAADGLGPAAAHLVD